MADGVEDGHWPIEEIPNIDTLYMRVFALHTELENGRLVPNNLALRNHGDVAGMVGMSTDWDRYSTPEITRGGSPRRPASDFGVVAFPVESVRAIPHQRVMHSPAVSNRAHTDVLGPKSKKELSDRVLLIEIQNRFRALAVWAIRPDDPAGD